MGLGHTVIECTDLESAGYYLQDGVAIDLVLSVEILILQNKAPGDHPRDTQNVWTGIVELCSIKGIDAKKIEGIDFVRDLKKGRIALC